MSQRLIGRSPDLSRLRDEGYDIEVRAGHLLVKDVPYVNSSGKVGRGTLVSELTLAGDTTTTPGTHVVYFTGDHPCNRDGSEIAKIKHQSERKVIDGDLVVLHSFSSKPTGGYADYHQKMTTYVAIISGPARSLEPSATARTFPVVEAAQDESVFNYIDTASSRAHITTAARKLMLNRVAIVGVGGTGSYILDLIAKVAVGEIHLFDEDTFSQHNAFRSPGAASIEELRGRPTKVAHLTEKYSRMHRHIIPHPYRVDSSNLDELRGMDCVFLCLDVGEEKRALLDGLQGFGVTYIDVGMGIYLVDDSLGGILRVTTCTKHKQDHIGTRIPTAGPAGQDDYSTNIQVADLNALNAALAVIRWKKLCGFYLDFEKEHHSAYTIDGNSLINDDQA